MAFSFDLPKKEMAARVWDAIAVTCGRAETASLIMEDLEQMQAAGYISMETLLLAVEDPRPGIGSGGATINALIMICEHFCVKEDLTVLNPIQLVDKRILIIHAGREFTYEPLGGVFLRLPCRYQKDMACDFPVTNLHWIYQLLTEKIALMSLSGVWVCSGDMVISLQDPFEIHNFDHREVVAFSFPASTETALKNGIYDIDEDGYLRDIVYKGSIERIRECACPRADSGALETYPLVTGLVFFPLWVAEKLLSMYSVPPLDACTYMGVDGGTPPVEVSLFFDILASMSCREKVCMGSGDDRNRSLVRRVMSASLQSCRVRIVHLKNAQCVYMSMSCQETMRAISDLCKEASVRSFEFENKSGGWDLLPWYYNCLSPEEVKLVSTVQPLGLAASRYCLGDDAGCVWAVLPDDPFKQLSGDRDSLGSETLADFYARTGIREEDLWCEADPRCFSTARFFPVESDILEFSVPALLSWLFLPESELCSESAVTTWRRARRLSLKEMRNSINPKGEYCNRRRSAMAEAEGRIGSILGSLPGTSSLSDTGIRPFLRWFVCIGESKHLLAFLDALAQRWEEHPGQVARILAAEADLLGAMARKRGGLRSGPASNRSWGDAFATLRSGDVARGVTMMTEERCHWLNSPDRLIRAGRHFERASQILIGKAVMTAKEKIRATRSPELCGRFGSVTAECPARLDIAGGWSDTPPLCYENGGAVVNISISVNGSLPIGAHVQRINEPVFRIQILDTEIVISSAEDLADFDNPMSPGALVKATLVFASLAPPLQAGDGSTFGLCIRTWSNLPHGSGLGTSSIMSAALLSALWTMDGWTFTDSDVIQGVLIVEQLMTTGGGWQDQVGGVGKGIQIGLSMRDIPLAVSMEQLTLTPTTLKQLNDRLVLLYSGKTRLAKNLLQDVIRNWYARDVTISQNVEDLVANAKKCKAAFQRGNLADVAHCLNQYWVQKKVMAPGSEPHDVTRLMDAIRPVMSCMALAGAGGGGFLFGLLENDADSSSLKNKVLALKKELPDLEYYDCAVWVDGMILKMDT